MSPTPNDKQQILSRTAIFKQRQNLLSNLLRDSGLASIILNPGPTLTYLTGLQFHLMERPVVAIFSSDQPVYLVIPELEAAKTSNLSYPTQVFQYGEDPSTWLDVFRKAVQAAELEGQIGVEPNRLRFLELRLVEAAAPEAHFQTAESVLVNLRIRKDTSELAYLRRAVEIAQHALENTLPMIRTGLTERQVASELTQQLLKAGADPEMPFSPIVASGPNSANPHAAPSDRLLQEGDLLVIDWGAYFGGYCSDLTRTFALGKVDPEMSKIADIVKEANQAGRAAAKPGEAAEVVDQAARKVIDRAGYGAYFTHRTGHGIGMEGHEAPYMRAGNSKVLEPGMVFTVEPGIYLPGRNGVRIEDDVVITDEGSETLSTLPRQLISIE
jgi:Xaa-Pro aminopeptidase